MTEIVKYVADDGTEFDDEIECAAYELQCRLNGADILFFDEKYNPISLTVTNCDNCWAVVTHNETELKILLQLFEDYGTESRGLTETGAFYWDADHSCWVNVASRIDKLTSEIDKLERIVRYDLRKITGKED